MAKQKNLTQKEKREQIKVRLLTAPELSNRAIAKSLKVSPSTVGTIRGELLQSDQIGQLDTYETNWMEHPYLKSHPEILDGLSDRSLRAIKADGVLDLMQETGSRSPVYCQRLLRLESKANRRKAAAIEISPKDIALFYGDIRLGLPQIKPESVDAIICDPPYGAKYLDVFEPLSRLAARVLKPGGSLICMCGQSHLDEKMTALSRHMRYHWQLVYLAERTSSGLHWIGITPRYKSVLWYTNGTYKPEGRLVSDVIKIPPDDGDRDLHIWGQSTVGFEELIKLFSEPGQTVCDPFLGSGTTAVAAVKLGRKFVGCDIDPKWTSVTKKRLEEYGI